MTNERILEYLMLTEILSTVKPYEIDVNQYEKMDKRYGYLRDKFINEYKPTIPIIKDPVKDDIATEE